ncbi:MAG: hypothetical protein AAGL98_01830 [Planctomycetota bacterium]
MSNAAMTQLFVLGSMAFALVTVVLYTLAHQMGSAIERHDLIRNARLQQQAYLRSLAERRRGANADYDTPAADADGFNVDVEDDFNVDMIDAPPGSAPGIAPANAPRRAA